MKNRYKAFGIIIMMIIVLLAVGCGGTGTGNPKTSNNVPSTRGRLTITGLGDYDGYYIAAFGNAGYDEETGETDVEFFAGGGLKLPDWTYIGTRISNGQAVLNVWEELYDDNDEEFIGLNSYSGNDQNAEFYVIIFSGSTLGENNNYKNETAYAEVHSVNFSNGTATAAISNIVPVVKLTLNGMDGSLSAYHDEEDNDSSIEIYFYDHNVAIEGYNYNDYKQDFKLYVSGNLVSSDIFSLNIEGGFIEFHFNNTDLLTIGESCSIRIEYTANGARPIKVWLGDEEEDEPPPANAATLNSFDTGTKTVIVSR